MDDNKPASEQGLSSLVIGDGGYRYDPERELREHCLDRAIDAARNNYEACAPDAIISAAQKFRDWIDKK